MFFFLLTECFNVLFTFVTVCTLFWSKSISTSSDLDILTPSHIFRSFKASYSYHCINLSRRLKYLNGEKLDKDYIKISWNINHDRESRGNKERDFEDILFSYILYIYLGLFISTRLNEMFLLEIPAIVFTISFS